MVDKTAADFLNEAGATMDPSALALPAPPRPWQPGDTGAMPSTTTAATTTGATGTTDAAAAAGATGATGAATTAPGATGAAPAPATGATGATGVAATRAAVAGGAPTQTFQRLTNAQYKALSPADQKAYDRKKAAAASAAQGFSDPPVSQNLWASMSADQRQAYIAAHPNSPEAAGKGAALGTSTASSSSSTGFAAGYTAPPPAKAEDYQAPDKSFIPKVPDDEPTATTWDVTPEQTVQGQMKQLTTDLQTNPVYQSLASAVKRASAAAGGGNSLMAETAAYDKVIGLAFNVASADAATFAKSAEFNATMKNQFSLATQQFMHTALLSDQNYKQSQVLQSEQIKGNLDSVDRQVAGQLESTRVSAAAQVEAAGEMAGAQISSSSISAEASMENAKLAAATSLSEADLQRKTTLDAIDLNFKSAWSLGQEQTAGELQRIGAQTGATIAINADAFVKNATLARQSDMSTGLNQLEANLTAISTMPGLTPQQQANAVETATSWHKTDQALKDASWDTITHGAQDGTLAGAIDPNNPLPGAPAGATASNPYGVYGNYMVYPGYDISPAPEIGGAMSNVGAQNQTAQPTGTGRFVP
jgi:hypothetical protein